MIKFGLFNLTLINNLYTVKIKYARDLLAVVKDWREENIEQGFKINYYIVIKLI